MKRICTIQDISCLGKCSTTVALPLISAMGVETVILPTAILSTHTMFSDFTVKDLSDELLPIVKHWKSQDVHFDALYTGYLGSVEEIELVKEIFAQLKEEGTQIFIDPVMADHGKLYPAFDMDYVQANAQLCQYADIIVPNLTEACFMTGMEYKEDYDEEYVKTLLQELAKLGSKIVVVTGIGLSEGKTGVYGLDTTTGKTFIYQNDLVDAQYHGTGDIFSSVTLGALMRDYSLEEAFALAADYTAKTIEVTMEDPKKPWYGVNFEETLPWLIQRLK